MQKGCPRVQGFSRIQCSREVGHEGDHEFPHEFEIRAGSMTSPPEPVATLRDQFAMAALTGLCANVDMMPTESVELAECAYDHADAMMEARKTQLKG